VLQPRLAVIPKRDDVSSKRRVGELSPSGQVRIDERETGCRHRRPIAFHRHTERGPERPGVEENRSLPLFLDPGSEKCGLLCLHKNGAELTPFRLRNRLPARLLLPESCPVPDL